MKLSGAMTVLSFVELLSNNVLWAGSVRGVHTERRNLQMYSTSYPTTEPSQNADFTTAFATASPNTSSSTTGGAPWQEGFKQHPGGAEGFLNQWYQTWQYSPEREYLCNNLGSDNDLRFMVAHMKPDRVQLVGSDFANNETALEEWEQIQAFGNALILFDSKDPLRQYTYISRWGSDTTMGPGTQPQTEVDPEGYGMMNFAGMDLSMEVLGAHQHVVELESGSGSMGTQMGTIESVATQSPTEMQRGFSEHRLKSIDGVLFAHTGHGAPLGTLMGYNDVQEGKKHVPPQSEWPTQFVTGLACTYPTEVCKYLTDMNIEKTVNEYLGDQEPQHHAMGSKATAINYHSRASMTVTKAQGQSVGILYYVPEEILQNLSGGSLQICDSYAADTTESPSGN